MFSFFCIHPSSLLSLIFVICLGVIFKETESYRVYLIGDSVDRFMVQDWCNMDQPNPPIAGEVVCPSCSQWYEHREGKANPFFCQKGNDSIANLFLFGSKDEAPYYQNYGRNEVFHSKNLLPRATEVYFEKFGVPDLIVFQIMLWDLGYFDDHFQYSFSSYNNSEVKIRHSLTWNATISWYESNMRKRIHDLQTVVSKYTNHSAPVNIALRSTVYNYVYGAKIHDMNIVLKGLAKEYGFSFFDFGDELWSNYDYHYHNPHYVRALTREDGYHPAFSHSVAVAEILLGLKYTRNMIYRGSLAPRYPVCLFFTDNADSGNGKKNTQPSYTCSLRQLGSKEYVAVRAVALLDQSQRSEQLLNFADSSVSFRVFYKVVYPSNATGVVRRSQAYPSAMRKHMQIPPSEVFLLSQSVLDRIPFE